MTERAPVSVQRPIWYDAQQVDETDLNAEQLANETIEASIIDNHVGDGILPEVLVSNIIFNSSLTIGALDGLPIFAQNQPSDSSLGNQLSISLSGSGASGQRQIKVCIIGLDFEDNLIYEIFYFDTNEIQTSRQHFAAVLLLLFQDFIGNPELSFNLGGELVISEASPMTLSRDVIMLAQDQQPSLFWSNFFLDPSVTQTSVQTMIQAALPLYNVADLNIYTTALTTLPLLSGDVTTQIGQKFQATTNNIQKVTLLLSVRNLSGSTLVWTGDIVVSIYPLQVSLDCPTDLVPNLPIDYSPSNVPYAQISFNYTSLLASGIVLSSVPQPVDFVFSNSPIAGGNIMTAGQYCAVTLKRSGSANQCDILLSAGQALLPNSWVTTFSGNLWVDITNENLWFRIWTDAAKVSDGQAYDQGNGVSIPKTVTNPVTQATIDNILGAQQFAGSGVFTAVLAAVTQDSAQVPDQRTGNPVASRQQYVPQITLTDSIDLTNLEKASTPLLLGSIVDSNIKFFDPSQALINVPLYSATLVDDELLIKIVDDPTDTYRFNSLVTGLVSHLLLGDLVSAQIIPDITAPSTIYRIASAKLCTMLVGDVDGNGIIDAHDLALLNSFVGFNMNQGLPLQTSITIDGYALTFIDGYATLNDSPISSMDGYTTATYVNGYQSLSEPFTLAAPIPWLLIDPSTNIIVADGYDGVLQPNPNDVTLANFTSASVNFNTIVGLSSYNLIILSSGPNLGGWNIVSLDAIADVLTVHKTYLSGDVFAQMFRADIDGDFVITNTDGYLLDNYIARQSNIVIPPTTYPAPSTNPYTKIGTQFQVIRLRLEEFVDRDDDYAANPAQRAATVHPIQDIFSNDGYFANHNYLSSPIQMSITKQLVWDPSLVVSSSQSRLVPSVFTYETGFILNSCNVAGVTCNVYPIPQPFDPGRVDFFVPNNLIIGNGGQLQTTAGDFYKVDFEVGTIVLEIPDGLFGSERTIDIMGDFIATTVVNGVPTGLTNLGFPAMRFADCSFVTANALNDDQLRFGVSVQSFSPNTNGLGPDGYEGAIVDGKMGVSIDFATGLLTLNFTNLYQDPVLQTLSTKVQVSIFLKQGGFNNAPLFVNSDQVGNMLNLISVFSGANDGGPSALVELGNDVSGILPIVNGGTGLNAVGANGTVLTSTGGGLSYQFIYDLIGVVPYSTGDGYAGLIPKLDGYGFLDPSFMYKNPIYIYGLAGVASNDSTTPTAIGAFVFRFDRYILEGWDSFKLEAIIETTNASNLAQIRLYCVNTNTYLNLGTSTPIMSTASTSAVLVTSQDLSSELLSGATDYVYEIHLSLSSSSGTNSALCKMARLVITYNNLSLNSSAQIAPPLASSYNFVPFLPSPTPS